MKKIASKWKYHFPRAFLQNLKGKVEGLFVYLLFIISCFKGHVSNSAFFFQNV